VFARRLSAVFVPALILTSMVAASANDSGAGILFVEPLVTPLVATKAGFGALGIATGDFNDDGKLDLAVTWIDDLGAGSQTMVSVMLGNGDETFQPPVTLFTLRGNVYARGILAKDFDGDGEPDLVTDVGEAREVLFFKGHGDGSFDDAVPTPTTHRSAGVQTADLRRHGKLDLVTVNGPDNTVSVLLGHGNGSFDAPTNYDVAANPQDVALGDVNGDGAPDIVVGSYDERAISVLLNRNDGTGTFGAATTFTAKMQVFGVYLAKFDDDDKLDIVATGWSGPSTCNLGCMGFFKGDGNGNFTVPDDASFVAVDQAPAHRYWENVVPDIDGDGKLDVLLVDLQDNIITVALGNGDGTFRTSYWVGWPGPEPGGQPGTSFPDAVGGAAAVPADFDGDHVVDLAVAAYGTDSRGGVSILPGDAPGTFKAPRSYQASGESFRFASALQSAVFGDFKKGGGPDLAVIPGGGNNVACEGGPNYDVFLNSGYGSLEATFAEVECSDDESPRYVHTADFDKDGNLDLIWPTSVAYQIPGRTAPAVQIAAGNGDGTFAPKYGALFPNSFAPGGSPQNLIVADFDGDGFPDYAVWALQPGCQGEIDAFVQSGSWMFTNSATLALGSLGSVSCGPGAGMVAADFDKDDKTDIITRVTPGAQPPDQVLFFKGKGNGTFEAAAVVGSGLPEIFEYVAADVNHDGKLDLIGLGVGDAWVQLGNGNGSFQPPVNYPASVSPAPGGGGALRVADFDGDGFLDIGVVGAFSFARGFVTLRGNGDGTFGAPLKFAVGNGGISLDVADLNCDGKADVVTDHSGINGNRYTVLLTGPPCVGDCNEDRRVTATDLVTMVRVALDDEGFITCQDGDRNHDGRITVDEIVWAVNNSFHGCGC